MGVFFFFGYAGSVFFFNFFLIPCIFFVFSSPLFIYLFYFIYFWLCCVLAAARGPPSHCGGLSLQSTGSRCAGLSSCGMRAQQLWLADSRAQAQQPRCRGSAAPRHVGSSWTRARTRVTCTGRRTHNHCTTREALDLYYNIEQIDEILTNKPNWYPVEKDRFVFYLHPSQA